MANQEQDASREAIRKRLLAALEPAKQASQAAAGASAEALRADLTRQLASGGTATPSGPVAGFKSPPAKVVGWQEVLRGPKKEASGLGFRGGEMLTNVPSSFYKQAKAVLWDLPLQAGANLIQAAKNPKQYMNDVAITGKYLPDIARIIKGDYEDFYSPDTFGENVTEDPLRPVADLAGLASVAGGGTAVAGKTAASALRGVSRGAAKVAAGVGRVGRAVAKVERLDPSELVLRGVQHGIKPLATAIGMSKYSNKFKTIDATLGGEADWEAFQIGEKVTGPPLTPQDHFTIIDSFAEANVAKNQQLADSNPALWARREKIKEWLLEDQKYYTSEEKIIKDEDALGSRARAWLRWKTQKGDLKILPDGTTRPLILDDAFESINKGESDPIYFKIFGEHDKSIFDAFKEKRFNGGVLSRSEVRASRGEMPTDINQILSHQLRTTIGTKKNLKFLRAATEEMAKNGDLRYVTSKTTPEELRALKKAGFAPMQGAFYEKYNTAVGKAINSIAEAAKQPGNMVQNVATAGEKVKAVLLAAEEALTTPPTEVWAPAGAVNWINLRLNPGDSLLGSVIRFGLTMGGTLPYYKAIATVLNPRYWIANAVGDAALAVLYGVHPQALKYAHKLKDMAPLEIRNIGINKLYQTDYNLFMRAANRLQNYAQNIDNFFKRAVWINEQVKIGVEKKLLKVGRDFFVAEDQMIPFIRHMAAAPNAWVDNLEAITKANEALAKTGMARAEIDKQRQALNKRNARSSAKDGPKGKVAADPVYGGAKHEAELYPDSKVSRPEKNAPTMADDIYGAGKAAPEVDDLKLKGDERYKEVKANLKSVLRDETPGNDRARAEAIDRMVQELAQLGREAKKVAKPAGEAAGAADEVAKVDPFSGDFSLGTPAEGKAVGPYDYQAGAEAQKLSPTQDRLRIIARQLDDNQMAQEQAFADMLWRVNELDQLRAVSPKLAAESQMADKAIEATARFFGSYNRLHPWEKKVVRQFIPFYTFTKAMTQLAFRLPFMMPKRQMVYLNLWRTWNDVIDNDGPQNSFYRSVVPVAALENGDIIAIKVNSLNPFGGLRSTGVAGFEIPAAFDILGNHPILRLAMSRGQVTAKPLQPGVMGTRLDNGEVWRYTADGFKRTLLQPSWAKSLWSMFPQGQLLDTLLPGAQEEGGFLLNPKTITGPDGQPLYPIGWPERLITAIVPATRLNPEKMMQRDMAKLLQIRRSYMKELRSSSPAKREVILTILREMSGDIRKRYLEY